MSGGTPGNLALQSYANLGKGVVKQFVKSTGRLCPLHLSYALDAQTCMKLYVSGYSRNSPSQLERFALVTSD